MIIIIVFISLFLNFKNKRYNNKRKITKWGENMEKPTRLALLKEIAEYLNEETELYNMMNKVLDYLINGSSFTTGWIFLINKKGEQELVASTDLPHSLKNNNCEYLNNGTCWCVNAYHHKNLTKASNIINCSRINLANQESQKDDYLITHHATVPLRSGDEQYGLLNVATPHTVVYSQDDLELLESVALQIGSAIKRIYLTDQEKEAARISERNRLARDLHDSVNQMLFSLKLTAHAAHDITEDRTAKKAFKLIEDTSQNAVNEMRALIWQLKPIGLEHGLVNAIEHYANMLDLKLNIEVRGLIKLSNLVEENVYRMLQEALNNTKKHAQTNQVSINMQQNEHQLYIKIYDDGKGFNVSDDLNQTTHGLKNIKQRIHSLDGEFNIQSDKQMGTTIYLNIPI